MSDSPGEETPIPNSIDGTIQREIFMARFVSWLFDKNFLRCMLPLALPIALQNLLMCSFRIVDTLMIGQLGDVAIAAVGLAGQVSFLVELIAFGFAAGASVFIAQYHGAGNRDGILRSFGATFLYCMPVGLLVTAATFCFPGKVMAVLTNEPEMIEAGAAYLHYACFSCLGLCLYQPMAVLLRSTENVRIPMFTSIVAALANAVLNYGLIFGRFGLPEMGVAGAGLATAVSSLINPLLMLIISLAQQNVLAAPIKKFVDISPDFRRAYWRRVLPALLNEGIWGLSVIFMNMVFGRMGTDNYAALTVYRTIENIVFVFFIGICSACNILIGKRIGEGNIPEVKDYAKRFICYIPLLGITLGAGIILLRHPLVGLFDISAAARVTTLAMLMFYGMEVTFRNVPYLTIVGVFRGGGDTRFGLMADLFCQYLLSLPVAYVCGLVLGLPFLTTFIILYLVEDGVKSVACFIHYRRMKWIRPVEGVPGIEEGQEA